MELQTGINELQHHGSFALSVQVTPTTAGTGSLVPEKSPHFQEEVVRKERAFVTWYYRFSCWSLKAA